MIKTNNFALEVEVILGLECTRLDGCTNLQGSAENIAITVQMELDLWLKVQLSHTGNVGEVIHLSGFNSPMKVEAGRPLNLMQ